MYFYRRNWEERYGLRSIKYNKRVIWGNITDRDNGSLVDSLRSAMRILVGSALAPAPVADRTFKPLRTHAARSATYYT